MDVREDWALPDADNWDEHRRLVEAAQKQRNKARKKPAKKPKKRRRRRVRKKTTAKRRMTARQKRLEKTFRGIHTKTIYQELQRRSNEARLAKLSPEQRRAMTERASAAAIEARSLCRHTKHPPKLRTRGKDAGKYYCPSCYATVPPPVVKETGELETVT